MDGPSWADRSCSCRFLDTEGIPRSCSAGPASPPPHTGCADRDHRTAIHTGITEKLTVNVTSSVDDKWSYSHTHTPDHISLTCPLVPIQFLLKQMVFWSIVFCLHWWQVVPCAGGSEYFYAPGNIQGKSMYGICCMGYMYSTISVLSQHRHSTVTAPSQYCHSTVTWGVTALSHGVTQYCHMGCHSTVIWGFTALSHGVSCPQ